MAYSNSQELGYGSSFYFGLALALLTAFFSVLFLQFDFRRVSENLVLFDRKAGRIIAADPTIKFKRAKDIRFLSWDWRDCDFAIERVVMSATAAQTFHLRAVRRNAQGTHHTGDAWVGRRASKL